MYRVADLYSKENNILAIVNGESISQVASQTLPSLKVIGEVTNLPIIRPVSCFDKTEIIELAKQINTYETSILPYEDCCTIFVPPHPVINPNTSKCLKYEALFDYEPMINWCVNNIKLYNKPDSLF